jgi:hypothetical protein
MSRKLWLAFAVSLLSAATVLAARTRPVQRSGPTFSKEVVRVFQQHCQTCHHPGDIAPFSLMTYAEAKPYASRIRMMTSTRAMPPWKPTDGCGQFKGERKLTQGEIDLLGQWVDAGAPEGNPADLPQPIDFSDGWALGQPDLVLRMPVPYTPPGDRDMYRCFVLPAGTTEEKLVSTIDTHPGDRTIVHHMLTFIDATGDSEVLDALDPDPGYTCFGGPGFLTTDTLGGWAPGARPAHLPDGIAMSLPARSRVVMQVHYHPHHGMTGPDQTEIGVYFATAPVQRLLRVVPIINNTFVIPAGAKQHPVTAQLDLPFFATGKAWWVAPHMHLLGKKMRVEVRSPSGQQSCLVNIDDWDFNWQGAYLFQDPVSISGGSSLQVTAEYDNSSTNPRNPNTPPKDVTWGEETTDEMCLAFVGMTFDADVRGKSGFDTSWIPAVPPR